MNTSNFSTGLTCRFGLAEGTIVLVSAMGPPGAEQLPSEEEAGAAEAAGLEADLTAAVKAEGGASAAAAAATPAAAAAAAASVAAGSLEPSQADGEEFLEDLGVAAEADFGIGAEERAEFAAGQSGEAALLEEPEPLAQAVAVKAEPETPLTAAGEAGPAAVKAEPDVAPEAADGLSAAAGEDSAAAGEVAAAAGDATVGDDAAADAACGEAGADHSLPDADVLLAPDSSMAAEESLDRRGLKRGLEVERDGLADTGTPDRSVKIKAEPHL